MWTTPGLSCFSVNKHQMRYQNLISPTQMENRPGGVLPYMGYIGMCGPKGYGFSAVLVINRVSNVADSVINRV